jgi:transposase
MANVRKNHTTEFKVKVAVEAIRQQKTINELTTEYGVHARLSHRKFVDML